MNAPNLIAIFCLALLFSPLTSGSSAWLLIAISSVPIWIVIERVLEFSRKIIFHHLQLNTKSGVKLQFQPLDFPPNFVALNQSLKLTAPGAVLDKNLLGFNSHNGNAIWISDSQALEHTLLINKAPQKISDNWLNAFILQHLLRGTSICWVSDFHQGHPTERLSALCGSSSRSNDLAVFGSGKSSNAKLSLYSKQESSQELATRLLELSEAPFSQEFEVQFADWIEALRIKLEDLKFIDILSSLQKSQQTLQFLIFNPEKTLSSKKISKLNRLEASLIANAVFDPDLSNFHSFCRCLAQSLERFKDTASFFERDKLHGLQMSAAELFNDSQVSHIPLPDSQAGVSYLLSLLKSGLSQRLQTQFNSFQPQLLVLDNFPEDSQELVLDLLKLSKEAGVSVIIKSDLSSLERTNRGRERDRINLVDNPSLLEQCGSKIVIRDCLIGQTVQERSILTPNRKIETALYSSSSERRRQASVHFDFRRDPNLDVSPDKVDSYLTAEIEVVGEQEAILSSLLTLEIRDFKPLNQLTENRFRVENKVVSKPLHRLLARQEAFQNKVRYPTVITKTTDSKPRYLSVAPRSSARNQPNISQQKPSTGLPKRRI